MPLVSSRHKRPREPEAGGFGGYPGNVWQPLEGSLHQNPGEAEQQLASQISFASLESESIDLGIPPESENHAVGITHR